MLTPQWCIVCAVQAKNCGDVLVVGLIPDSEILRCKGPPVCNEEERKLQVETVKWVDEVITGMPRIKDTLFSWQLLLHSKIGRAHV